MYMSDADGDDFVEVCLPVNLEDDGYNMIRTHDDYAAFILAGGGWAEHVPALTLVSCTAQRSAAQVFHSAHPCL